MALLAGAVGNLIDRVRWTAVVDFIDLTILGVLRWPAFNLADLYLAVGLALCAAALAMAAMRATPRRTRAASDAG
jgi:signal peptidase II